MFRWAKFCAAVAALVVVACGPARADLFDFSYTVFGGINASGTLTATLQSGSTYLITAISGTRNGQPILTLFAPGGYDGNDNLLYFPAGGDNPEGNAYIDFNGFSYTTAEGNFNPWACGTSCAEDPPEYDEEHGTPNPTGSTIITSFSMTQESAPAPIPGAGALSYLAVLFGGLAVFRRRALASAQALLVAAAPAWFTRRQCPGSQNGFRA